MAQRDRCAAASMANIPVGALDRLRDATGHPHALYSPTSRTRRKEPRRRGDTPQTSDSRPEDRSPSPTLRDNLGLSDRSVVPSPFHAAQSPSSSLTSPLPPLDTKTARAREAAGVGGSGKLASPTAALSTFRSRLNATLESSRVRERPRIAEPAFRRGLAPISPPREGPFSHRKVAKLAELEKRVAAEDAAEREAARLAAMEPDASIVDDRALWELGMTRPQFERAPQDVRRQIIRDVEVLRADEIAASKAAAGSVDDVFDVVDDDGAQSPVWGRLDSTVAKDEHGLVSSLDSAERRKYFGANGRIEMFKSYKDLTLRRQSVDDGGVTLATVSEAPPVGKLQLPQRPLRSSQRRGSTAFDAESPTNHALRAPPAAAPASRERRRGSRAHRDATKADDELSDGFVSITSGSEHYTSESDDGEDGQGTGGVDPEELRRFRDITQRSQEASQSARHSYLKFCRDNNLMPEPFVVRKADSPYLNLRHYGLGPKRAGALAVSLRGMPALSHIDVYDNRIDDEAMAILFEAIKRRGGIYSLNVGGNPLAQRGADALLDMLAHSESLKELHLPNMKIDDEYADEIADGVAANRFLVKLNMSANCFKTVGARHFANMLRVNTSLCVLDLSWNDLRAEGGREIAVALGEVACPLYDLNLEWNGLGNVSFVVVATALLLAFAPALLTRTLLLCHPQEGAAAIGLSLRQNTTLARLNVANNAIQGTGAMALAQGLSSNSRIAYLCLDKNPIGRPGARAVMRALNAAKPDGSKGGDPKEVSMEGCTFDEEKAFDPGSASGTYELDLNTAFDRTIANEILALAGKHVTCELEDIKYLDPETNKWEDVSLCRTRVPIPRVQGLWMLVRDNLGAYLDFEAELQARKELEANTDPITGKERLATIVMDAKRARKTDAREGRGGGLSSDAEEDSQEEGQTAAAADAEGEEETKDAMPSADEEDDSSDEEDAEPTLTMGLKAPTEGAITDCWLETASAGRWHVLPTKGTLMFRCYYEVERPKNIHKAQKGIIGLVAQIDRYKLADKQRLELLHCSAADQYFHLNDANMMLRSKLMEKSTSVDRINAVHRLLFRLVDSDQAPELVKGNLSGVEQRMLVAKLGPFVGVVVGNPTGHYKLDFSVEEHKECFDRLIEINAAEKDLLRKRWGNLDVSQHGNGDRFRNETCNGEPMIIRPREVSEMKEDGVYEFDFVSTTRPSRRKRVMKKDGVNELLRFVGITALNEMCAMILDEITELEEIARHRKELAESHKVKRNPRWEPEDDESVASAVDKPLSFEEAKVKIAEVRERIPWVGPPEFTSAVSIVPNPNPLPRWSKTASCTTVKDGKPHYSMDKAHFPEIFLKCELEPAHEMPREVRQTAFQMLGQLRLATAPKVFTCRQVEHLIRSLARGIPGLREEVFIILFARIIDLRNVARPLWALTQPERQSVIARLGILTMWDPMAPDGYFEMELRRPEERRITEFLVRLASELLDVARHSTSRRMRRASPLTRASFVLDSCGAW